MVIKCCKDSKTVLKIEIRKITSQNEPPKLPYMHIYIMTYIQGLSYVFECKIKKGSSKMHKKKEEEKMVLKCCQDSKTVLKIEIQQNYPPK